MINISRVHRQGQRGDAITTRNGRSVEDNIGRSGSGHIQHRVGGSKVIRSVRLASCLRQGQLIAGMHRQNQLADAVATGHRLHRVCIISGLAEGHIVPVVDVAFANVNIFS